MAGTSTKGRFDAAVKVIQSLPKNGKSLSISSMHLSVCSDFGQIPTNVTLHKQGGPKNLASFLARDSMLSALYAIARPSVCLSVRPSVRHTGGSVENG